MNQGAAAVTQKLDQLININLRMEKLMEKGQAADRSKKEGKDEKGGGKASKTNAEDVQNLSSLATAMTPLIEAINKSGDVDEDLGKNIAKIIVDISEGIKEAANNATVKEIDSISKMIEVVTKGAGKFMVEMALIAIIAPISFIGAMLFSATIVAMTSILAKSATLAPETTDGIQAVLDMAKGAALFGLAMIFYSIAAPIIALGALAFVYIVGGISSVLSQAATLEPETTEGIQAVLNMAKGAALFGLAMIFYSLLGPTIAMGALVFILVVGAMLMVFGLINKAVGPIDKGLASLNKIAIGAALFVLTFILASYFVTEIAMGALVTILAIGGMIAAFALINKFIGPIDAGLLSLNKIAIGAAIFVLTFIVASYFVKEIAIGALVTILAIAGMIFVLDLVGKKLTTAKAAAQVLQDIAKPIAILMAVFIATGFFAERAIVGALVTILAIGALILVLKFVSKDSKNIKVAAKVLEDIAKPIAILMAVFIATGYFAKEAAIGAIVTSIAIGLISAVTYGVGKFKKEISAGAKALDELIIPLLAFTAAIFVWSTIKDWDNVLLGGIAVAGAIVVLGLAAYVLGQPTVEPFAILGAGVLVVLAASLLIFSIALLILSKVKVTEEWADSIGYTFVVLGGAAAVMGFMSPLIVLGAIAMLTLAGPLILLAFSLAAFKKVKFTKTDGDNIGHAISSVISGFANTSILDALDAAATAQLVDVMSDGIIKLSSGLTDFKKVKYTEKDGVLIKDAIKSVVVAFSDAFEDLTFAKWMKISYGIDMLTKMGSAIAALAEGVGRMANLEVIEYEVINKGTPDQKLVAKGSRKLKESDFKAASDNIKAILGIDDKGEYGLINTLVAFGKAVDQGSNWFSNGYIETGLDMFTKLSSSLGNLAEGVYKMASLEIVTMGVIAPGTKDAKLVPTGSMKLDATHFKAAAENIKAILGIRGDGNGLIDVLTEFGRSMTAGEGIFSGGYIEKGIEGLSKISGSLTNLADGVYKMASLEVVTMGIIAPGTKDAKLVPTGSTKLNETHFAAAAANIGTILNALVEPLDKFGREMDGYFSGYVGEGIEGMAKLSSPLVELADLIIKIGGGQIEQKVVHTDPKTGAPMLIPGKVIDFKAALASAKVSLTDMLNFLPNQLVIFSKKYETISDSIESGLAGIDTMRAGLEDSVVPSIEMMSKAIETYVKANETLAKLSAFKTTPEDIIIEFVNKMMTLSGSTVALTMSEIIVPAMDDFLTAADKYSQAAGLFDSTLQYTQKPADMIIAFSSSMDKLGLTISTRMNDKTLKQFTTFNTQMTRLAVIASPFERFVKSFGDMAKHMGVFAKNFSVMDANGIMAFKDWTDSMVLISKVDINKSAAIIDFVNKIVDGAFGGGTSSTSAEKSPQDYSAGDKKAAINSQNEKAPAAGKPAAAQPQKASIDTKGIEAAIKNAFLNLNIETIRTGKIITGS
jgi:hypothetical protein